MFCKKCGKQIPDDSNACQYCGAMLTQRPVNNTYNQVNTNYQPVPPKQQKKTPWKIIVPIAAVVVVLAIVISVVSCVNIKKNEDKKRLLEVLEASTDKPVVEFIHEDYDGDGTTEAYAVVGESEKKEDYTEYYDADIYFVNQTEAEIIKESVSGHSNGTIEVDDTIYVSLEVYDEGTDKGVSFIYTAEENKPVESDISGKYSDVHQDGGKIVGYDDSNEIEIEVTDIVAKQVLSRTNYYDSEGKVVYFESYAYYDNGLLCSSTLCSLDYEYMTENKPLCDEEYTFLYLYDENGNVKEKVLGDFSGDLYDKASGCVFLDYYRDENGDYSELYIYPEKESIEQEKFGVDSSKTEKIYGEAFTISTVSGDEWAERYLNEIFVEESESDITQCTLAYVDNNSEPELWIDYYYGASGQKYCTQSDKGVDFVHVSHSFPRWIEKEGLLFLTGGHQGMYYDEVYKIQDGKFVVIGSGTTNDYNYEQTSTMNYWWESVEVSEKEYQEKLNSIFDTDKAAEEPSDVYTYEQCKMLLQQISDFAAQ